MGDKGLEIMDASTNNIAGSETTKETKETKDCCASPAATDPETASPCGASSCETLPPTHPLKKRALLLEYFTVGYNVVEGVLSVLAGYLAGSPALIGFGLDSAVESLSGGVLIWRLRVHGKVPLAEEERVEKKAVTFVGYSFFILGAYVLYESLERLYLGEAPEPSLFGIIIAAASIIIMPILGLMKRRTGQEMGSVALVADSKQTFVCAMLSIALLIGLGMNYLFGLWWADPAAALVITAFIFREGIETLKEGKLCGC